MSALTVVISACNRTCTRSTPAKEINTSPASTTPVPRSRSSKSTSEIWLASPTEDGTLVKLWISVMSVERREGVGRPGTVQFELQPGVELGQARHHGTETCSLFHGDEVCTVEDHDV